MKFLSLVACSSALEPKLCNTCKHFIAGKCKLFPLITNLNDDIVYEYDYVNCSTARIFMCNGTRYEKIELKISQKKIGKNASN